MAHVAAHHLAGPPAAAAAASSKQRTTSAQNGTVVSVWSGLRYKSVSHPRRALRIHSRGSAKSQHPQQSGPVAAPPNKPPPPEPPNKPPAPDLWSYSWQRTETKKNNYQTDARKLSAVHLAKQVGTHSCVNRGCETSWGKTQRQRALDHAARIAIDICTGLHILRMRSFEPQMPILQHLTDKQQLHNKTLV